MTGWSSAVNTSDLTIAPTGTPSAAAAWSAVRVESASSRISPDAPPSRRATATRSTLGCTPRTLVRDVDDDAGRVVEGQHAEPVLGADAEADADDAFEVTDQRDLAELRVVDQDAARAGVGRGAVVAMRLGRTEAYQQLRAPTQVDDLAAAVLAHGLHVADAVAGSAAAQVEHQAVEGRVPAGADAEQPRDGGRAAADGAGRRTRGGAEVRAGGQRRQGKTCGDRSGSDDGAGPGEGGDGHGGLLGAGRCHRDDALVAQGVGKRPRERGLSSVAAPGRQ